MTKMNDDRTFIRDWRDNQQRLTEAHAYRPEDEHEACGVGLIAAIDGKPRREVVLKGIEALKAVWHRGAVDAERRHGRPQTNRATKRVDASRDDKHSQTHRSAAGRPGGPARATRPASTTRI